VVVGIFAGAAGGEVVGVLSCGHDVFVVGRQTS
jgi:hypothetical protein